MRSKGLVLAAVELVAVAAVGWLALRDDGAGGGGWGEPGSFGPEWQQVATPPLSGRFHPHLVWNGEEVLVIGGRRTEAEGELSDAAAYDPSTDRWRTLTNVPDGLRDGVQPVVVGGLLVTTDDQDPGALVLYDAGADESTSVREPDLQGLSLVGGQDRVLAVRSCTCRLHPPTEQLLDLGTGAWSPLPTSPFDADAAHHIVPVGTDDYLFSQEEGRIQAAVRRGGTDEWAVLASGVGALTRPPLVVDGLVVSAEQPVAIDTPETHPPEVWAFDTRSEEWVDVPELTESVGPPPAFAGDGVVYVGDQRLDVATRTWSDAPPRPETWRLGSSSLWIGDRLFAVGGHTETGFADAAFTWTPEA